MTIMGWYDDPNIVWEVANYAVDEGAIRDTQRDRKFYQKQIARLKKAEAKEARLK